MSEITKFKKVTKLRKKKKNNISMDVNRQTFLQLERKSQYLRTKVVNYTNCPYSSQTWKCTTEKVDKIEKKQRAMDRQMLLIRLIERRKEIHG